MSQQSMQPPLTREIDPGRVGASQTERPNFRRDAPDLRTAETAGRAQAVTLHRPVRSRVALHEGANLVETGSAVQAHRFQICGGRQIVLVDAIYQFARDSNGSRGPFIVETAPGVAANIDSGHGRGLQGNNGERPSRRFLPARSASRCQAVRPSALPEVPLMIARTLKMLGPAVCFAGALFAAAAPVDAQACCGLFGCWSGCGPSYGACYRGGCNVSYYYAPSYCGSCSPCSTVAGSPCAAGDCTLGTNSSTANPEPTPDPNWKKKKTYSEEPAPGAGTDSEILGPGRSPRTSPDTGLDRNRDGSAGPGDSREDAAGGFSPPARINRPDGASPASSDIEGAKPGSSGPGQGKKGPAAPRIPDDNEESRIPPPVRLDLDGKIAWRPAVERKRASLVTPVSNARLVRLPAYPASEWQPVESASTLAKK
jgi:hypothetical protein